MRYQINQDQVVSELLDDEVILINLISGSYYSFTGSGPAIWEALLAGWTVDDIAARIAQASGLQGEDVAAEVEAFVTSLEAEKLIVVAEGCSVEALPPPSRMGPFVPPVLQKYTDMEELLLIDPIHEVTEAGWPLKAEKTK